MAAIRDPHLEPLAARLQELRVRAMDRTRALSESQLIWIPPSGGWSVAQCLGHLSLTHEAYDRTFAASLPALARLDAPTRASMPHTLMGRLMLWVVRPSNKRRFRTAGAFAPAAPNAEGAVQRFERSLDAMERHLAAADGRDLRHRIASPVSGLIRFSVGDAFAVIVNHVERHLDQVDGILNQRDFPG